VNLRQIEAFKAFMETGTVTMAAARLSISQPATSKLLQLFERSAGFELFVRDRGRLSPTREARLLYDEVERVFQGTQRIRQAAREILALERGSLAVGIMPALSVGFVQEILARLGADRPRAVVQVQARDTPRLVEQLVSQQIEVVLSVLPLEHPELRTESLCKVPLVCILPPGHPLAKRREIHCKDFAGEPFATFWHDAAVRRRIDQAFEDAKVPLHVVLEAPMAPTICAFVARRLGVAIVNPLYIGAFATSLVVRPFRPRIYSEISMATLRGRRLSALAEAFTASARTVAHEAAAAGGTITFGYG
jgi:DNA-binding transcriptional LysR family regulator